MQTRRRGLRAVAYSAAVLFSGTHSAAGLAQVVPASSAMDPKMAVHLANFGTSLVIGSADVIANVDGDLSDEDAEALGAELTSVTAAYQSSVSQATFMSNVVQSTGGLIITSAQLLATSTGVGAVPAALVGAVAHDANRRLASAVGGKLKGEAQGMLSRGLQRMSAQDKQAFDSLVEAGRHVQAVNLFEQRTGRLAHLARVVGDPAAAEMARETMVQTIAGMSSRALLEAGKSMAATQDLEKNFGDHLKNSKAFAADVSRRVLSLESSANELRQVVDGVADHVAAIRNDQMATGQQLAVIEEVLFATQPASVRLRLVESGMPGLSKERRTHLTAILKAEVRKQEIIATANKAVSIASDVNAILTNLGVGDPRLASSVQYAGTASVALNKALSGDYLGAIASVSGLLRNRQPDPMQVKLERIFDELRQIDAKLDTIVRLQQETLKAIDDLSKQLADLDSRLNDRLDHVDFELSSIGDATRAQLWGKYATCMRVGELVGVSGNYGYDAQTLSYTNAKGVQQLAEDYHGFIFPCGWALTGMFSQLRVAAHFENPLRLEFVKGVLPGLPAPSQSCANKPNAIDRFLTCVHGPSANFFHAAWAATSANKHGWGPLAGGFALLSTPSATVEELLARVAHLDAISGQSRACDAFSPLNARAKGLFCSNGGGAYDPSTDSGQDAEARAHKRALEYLDVAIVRDQVGHLVRWAAMASDPYNLSPGGAASGQPKRLADLVLPSHGDALSVEGRNLIPYGRALIEGAMLVSDITIAQQAMAYGDLTAYFIFRQLWDSAKKDFIKPSTPLQEAALRLLKNDQNPWLQRNVAHLVLRSAERPCSYGRCLGSAMSYWLAMSPLDSLKRCNNVDGEAVAAPKQEPIVACANSELSVPTEDDRRTVTALVLERFDLDPKVQFKEMDLLVGEGAQRKIAMTLGEVTLQVPSVKNWRDDKLEYPAGLFASIRDRELLAKRWADYAVFDELDSSTKVRLVRALAKGGPL